MLPGFRFLFAAIVLSMSILVFGLGAAALLRAAHEQFVSNPSWHATPETMFAQQSEATRPELALLRVEPTAAEREKTPDQVPAPAAPVEQATTGAAPSEQAAIVAAPAEPEKTAAPKPEQSAPAEVATPEVPAAQTLPPSEMPPAQADAPASPDAPAPAAETKTAATEQASPLANESALAASAPAASETSPAASEASPAAPEQPTAPAPAAADVASTKIATLGGQPVTIEPQPPAKAADAKQDDSAIKKRLHARRVARRRKIASRARIARQVTQHPADPFAQPLAQPPAAARKH